MIIQGVKTRVDDLGRIHIPKEYRKQLKIKVGQELELVIINDFIVIGKVRSDNNGK